MNEIVTESSHAQCELCLSHTDRHEHKRPGQPHDIIFVEPLLALRHRRGNFPHVWNAPAKKSRRCQPSHVPIRQDRVAQIVPSRLTSRVESSESSMSQQMCWNLVAPNRCHRARHSFTAPVGARPNVCVNPPLGAPVRTPGPQNPSSFSSARAGVDFFHSFVL